MIIMKKKINANVSIVWDTLYLNIRKEEIEKLDYNFQGKTCIKIHPKFVETFPAKTRPDLLDWW